MDLKNLSLLHFIAAGAVLYALWSIYVVLRRGWRVVCAQRQLKRYQAERDAYYGSAPPPLWQPNTKPP